MVALSAYVPACPAVRLVDGHFLLSAAVRQSANNCLYLAMERSD